MSEVNELPIKTNVEVPELTEDQRFGLWTAMASAIEREKGAYYDQRCYTQDLGETRDVMMFRGSCGTAACIAGHAVHEAVQLKILEPFALKDDYNDDVAGIARKLLGLSDDAVDSMFDAEFCDGAWPEATGIVAGVLREVRDLQKQGASEHRIYAAIEGADEDHGEYPDEDPEPDEDPDLEEYTL